MNKLKEHGLPGNIATVITGAGKDVGSKFAPDERLELISFMDQLKLEKVFMLD